MEEEVPAALPGAPADHGAFFYEEFYREVDRNAGFSTRSSRYSPRSRKSRARATSRETRLVLFAGFYALTRAGAGTCSRRLGGWPRVQFIFQDGPGMRRRLGGLGVKDAAEAAPACGGPTAPARETRFYSSPTRTARSLP